MRAAHALIVAVVLPGCFAAMIPPSHEPVVYQRTAKFSETEYAPYGRSGGATIEGQAFAMTRGGDSKKCAGRQVILHPATSYSTEWFEHAVLQEEIVQPIGDVRLGQYQRTTTSDADGRFVFENVPAGAYFVTCRVSWEVARTVCMGRGCYTTGDEQGGTVYARVTVAEGARVRVVVTR